MIALVPSGIRRGHAAARLLAILALLAPGTAPAAGGKEPAPHPRKSPALTLVPEERFDGSVAVRTKRGAVENLHVVLRKWQIHGRQRIAKFPEDGFLVVHLHSGKVVTVIDGKETARHGDDFWMVPAGSSMSIRVTSESALLETTAVRSR